MNKSSKKRRRGTNPLKVIAAILLIAAVAKELSKPKEERTWHGSLGGFVPYDFRKPTVDKFKSALWNPEGSIIANRPFGVGWTLNVGAVVAKVRSISKAT